MLVYRMLVYRIRIGPLSIFLGLFLFRQKTFHYKTNPIPVGVLLMAPVSPRVG